MLQKFLADTYIGVLPQADVVGGVRMAMVAAILRGSGQLLPLKMAVITMVKACSVR